MGLSLSGCQTLNPKGCWKNASTTTLLSYLKSQERTWTWVAEKKYAVESGSKLILWEGTVTPNNPEVLHEGHVIYREEAPSSWNRNPNGPTAVPLGPTIAISHPERHREPLEVEYETKIIQQNQLMKSLIDQNEALMEAVNELKTKINTLERKE